ncbi:hypothetical protein BC828DRAFT_378816 [Blastocladiella britannica]|nr:hypothetical protein BC828DRAFT_378816 [Blastocladiella britannica]
MDQELGQWREKLIGKTIVDGSAADDAASISRESLPRDSRVISPGKLVTLDFRPQRLNVELDDEGKVRQVHLG